MNQNTPDQPIYSSPARGWGNSNEYRIYSDRLELEVRFLFFRKLYVIPGDGIIDIWTSPPTTLRSLPRMGGLLKGIGRGLKLDWADAFEHVGIQCERDGFKFLFFAPEDPAGFEAAARKHLMGRG